MLYLNQHRPGPVEWPVYHTGSAHLPPLAGGVAPLRHDLALARHLEKRRMQDSTPATARDIRDVARALFGKFRCGALTLLHSWNAFDTPGLPIGMQPNLFAHETVVRTIADPDGAVRESRALADIGSVDVMGVRGKAPE